jgi:hypothetical protein
LVPAASAADGDVVPALVGRFCGSVGLSLLDRRLERRDQLGDRVDALGGSLNGLDAVGDAVEQAGELARRDRSAGGGEEVDRAVDGRVDLLAGGEAVLALLGVAWTEESEESAARTPEERGNGHDRKPFWDGAFWRRGRSGLDPNGPRARQLVTSGKFRSANCCRLPAKPRRG